MQDFNEMWIYSYKCTHIYAWKYVLLCITEQIRTYWTVFLLTVSCIKDSIIWVIQKNKCIFYDKQHFKI